MDVKQFRSMLKEHYDQLTPQILSRRNTCRDTLKDLRKLAKEKESDGTVKERAALNLRIERLKYHSKMYDVPVTKVMPLRVVVPTKRKSSEDFYFNGKLLMNFLVRLGSRYKRINVHVDPTTLRLNVDYETAYSKGRLQLNQIVIYGTGFAEFPDLIPTLNLIHNQEVKA